LGIKSIVLIDLSVSHTQNRKVDAYGRQHTFSHISILHLFNLDGITSKKLRMQENADNLSGKFSSDIIVSCINGESTFL